MVELRSKARGRTATWGAGAPTWVRPDSLGGFAGGAARHLAVWALADVGPGRLVPWLAVSFGFGIVLYFAAEQEPALWAAVALAVGLIAAAVLVRHRPIGFPLTVAAAAIAAGFATATIKRAMVAHPVLPAVAWNVEVTGFVEVREERERSDRIIVRVHHIEGPRLEEKLERVRVSVRKGTAPAVAPLMPGGYDFARAMYFQGIGASGFALGAIRTAPPPTGADTSLRMPWRSTACAIQSTSASARFSPAIRPRSPPRSSLASAMPSRRR
jgi:competence protein ComEC